MGAETILEQIRSSQAQEVVSAGAKLNFIIELAGPSELDTVGRNLEGVLQSRFQVDYLFSEGEGALDEDIRLRLFLLVIPALGFDQIEGSPFDLARWIEDNLENAKTVEPDFEQEFYNGQESALVGDCWATDEDEPTDRGWALRAIRAPEAWAFSQSAGKPSQGTGILVAQPDTGVAVHDELIDALRSDLGYDFIEGDTDPIDPLQSTFPWDSPGHGTGTSSVVASRGTVEPVTPGTESGTGGPGVVTGSAPMAKVVPIRAVRTVLRIQQSNVARAIDHARKKGCHVVTMSLGGLPSIGLWYAIRGAVKKNLIVMAAAGNCVGTVVWPARYDACIALGGINIKDKPWKGSSHGSSVDFSAPAEFVWRAKRSAPSDPENAASGGQGTSFAVAITAGVAALWLAHHGRDGLISSLGQGETLQERFRTLVAQSARVPADWQSGDYGAGIVDAEALLNLGPGQPSVLETVGSDERPPSYGTAAEAVLRDFLPSDGLEAPGGGIGLSPAELERFGLEICWIAMTKRQQEITTAGGLETPGTGPAPARISEELSVAVERAGNPTLAELIS